MLGEVNQLIQNVPELGLELDGRPTWHNLLHCMSRGDLDTTLESLKGGETFPKAMEEEIETAKNVSLVVASPVNRVCLILYHDFLIVLC